MQLQELYALYKKNPVVITDSRLKTGGGIFFALKGENFNGNDFAADAINNGCSVAILDEKRPGHEAIPNGSLIYVKNVLETIQQLAAYHRQQLKIPIIGITGSNGKTTTKELFTAVLSKKYKTFATRGNYNNHIGVPLSLLSVLPSHEIAVIEMGANHIGEIGFLCSLARPTHGIITNIGKAHLEGFGSPEGVLKAKTELYHSLQKDKGTVFYNIFDEVLNQQIKKFTFNAIPYSTGKLQDDCQYFGKIIDNENFLTCTFTDKKEGTEMKVNSQLMGVYNLSNLLAAFAVGKYFDVPNPDIKKALEGYIPDNLRSQIIEGKSNTIFMDAYNANASSMEAAIDAFLQRKTEKQKVLILGSMNELGQYAMEEHAKIINKLNQVKGISVYYIGSDFCGAGAKPCYLSVDNLKTFLSDNPISNSYILLKGSRSFKLENLLETLTT